ncbi:hypothetical protein O6H91_02G100300 [Diphasiastrum complanatum]|uniref:Uncharacterized protein n=1 Tax=Diphasiastrum complanatum TaxID=34168 RepID=A0ACC2EJ12_DIPCM|nr:hypothetical protein O6H91_02G100300 [Diphasiastrum complanatum]
MKCLTAQRICTHNLLASMGADDCVSASRLEAKLFSRKAHISTIRIVILAASPSPSFERKFETSSDSSISKQIPRLEPFNQSRIARGMRERSLIEKAERAVSDRCSELEGDEAYKCWEALFELEKMKEDCKIECNMKSINERPMDCHTLGHIEHIIRQSGGVSSLIDNLLMLAKVSKMQRADEENAEVANPQNIAQTGRIEATKAVNPTPSVGISEINEHERHEFPEPGCMPKTEEELRLEETALMPESSFTRLLRRRGTSASWFTKPREHETD